MARQQNSAKTLFIKIFMSYIFFLPPILSEILKQYVWAVQIINIFFVVLPLLRPWYDMLWFYVP